MVAEALQKANDANNVEVIAMLGNTSKVAIWKIIFYTVAFAIFTLEKLQDIFKLEIEETISKLKPHTLRWYAEKCKLFQYGYNLVPETDYYDNAGLTDEQIDDSKVIKHAAVVENEGIGLRIKVAVENNNELEMAPAGVMTALTDYVKQVKDAGIKILLSSGAPDDLKAKMRVFYNPQVLAADGSRIDGTDSEPVQNALKAYLKNLPFNGLFVPQLMVDKLQAVEGVVIIKDDDWLVRYAALDFTSVDFEYLPDAGYLRAVNDGLDIEFIPHSAI